MRRFAGVNGHRPGQTGDRFEITGVSRRDLSPRTTWRIPMPWNRHQSLETNL